MSRFASDFERHAQALFSGTLTTASPAPQKPFSLDKLLEMMDRLLPKETWLSSNTVDRTTAERVTTKRENWLVAHPDFWTHFMIKAAASGDLPLPFGIEVFSVDADPDDDMETAGRKARQWQRYCEAREFAESWAAFRDNHPLAVPMMPAIKLNSQI